MTIFFAILTAICLFHQAPQLKRPSTGIVVAMVGLWVVLVLGLGTLTLVSYLS
jgi:hypothetical protein